MTTLAIALTCLALLYGILYLAEQRKQRRKIERRLHGISALQTGVNLMTTVQQHRGLSAGVAAATRRASCGWEPSRIALSSSRN